MNNKTILLTNDDGIDSPGLRAAVEAVMEMGEVIIAAPTRQQTGTGRGLTGDKGSRLIPVEYVVNGKMITAFHCDCSPALIVRHSLRTIFPHKKPDLLISGINYGENLGTSITCSGTVGAALEAASSGVPGIAISKQTDIESHHKYTRQDWSTTIHFLNLFATKVMGREAGDDVDVLKIDVPHCATPETKWKFTKLARSGYYFKDIEEPKLDSAINDGKTIIKFNEDHIGHDTDIHALAIQKVISVTPLSIDLSSRVNLDDLEKMYES